MTFWCHDNHWVMYSIIAMYLAMVHVLPRVYVFPNSLSKSGLFTTTQRAWNLACASMSIAGAAYTVPHLFKAFRKMGLLYTVCTEPFDWYGDHEVGFFTMVFCLSKIPELLDTVFIILKNRAVSFLHWYHHATVMAFCWVAYGNRAGPGLWFASMNYVVHSVMYSYYACTSLRPIAPFVTALQIVQMFIGMFIVAYAVFVGGSGCALDRTTAASAGVMYGSYCMLFIQFALRKYTIRRACACRPPKSHDN